MSCHFLIKVLIKFIFQNETQLAGGDDFAKAASSLINILTKQNAFEYFMGVGVNCVNPKYVEPLFSSLLHELGENTQIPLIVYSNRGEIYDSEIGDWTGTEKCKPLISYVPKWLEMGVRIIGGCCRIYPRDISEVRKYVDTFNNQ